MKRFIAAWTLLTSLALYAEPKAEVIEHCSHDIMKLVKTGAVPADAAEKLHMIRVTEENGIFKVIAVLDHNEDHSQPVAHLRFQYDAEAKMQSYEYKSGYVTPNTSPFQRKSAAKLFDLAAEFLLDAADDQLLAYANDVAVMHLEYDKIKDAAFFEMVDVNDRGLRLWLDLDGKYLSHQFVD
jgi:hypothetical protein